MHFTTHTLGFPRMGINRELKRLLEDFWTGSISEEELRAGAEALRLRHWTLQRDMGVELVPVGDFSLYDHMLDAVAMLGAAPPRHRGRDLAAYFRMARGDAGENGATAMEMTKWFDTNYHYLVPEFHAGQTFAPSADRLLGQLAEARGRGFRAKAVLPGPMTFLALGKDMGRGFDRWTHADAVVEAYARIVAEIAGACEWIQLDEPVAALDLEPRVADLFGPAYERLALAAGQARLMLATYFGPVDHNASRLLELPVHALHLDLVRGPLQLGHFLERAPEAMALSLGLVDGRNVWVTDLDAALARVARAAEAVGPERVMLGTSCSLLHVPVDLDAEPDLEAGVRRRMAFARQKCAELAVLARAARGQDAGEALAANRALLAGGRKGRAAAGHAFGDDAMPRRSSPFPERIRAQRAILDLPAFPATTIGSFPQTPEIRRTRSEYRKGGLDRQAYSRAMRDYIADAVQRQEDLGLDVLVHGEPERNDMVEYFGERMEGFCFTRNGWVQSYGSRCVKPPVIHGDVSRPAPMTVEWTAHAQSLTDRPVKGMLTGPVTILCWSFVRDDQPRSETCRQIAMAVRDEVLDLERGGTRIIQVDEPALREGLPLRRRDHEHYLRWAVACFGLATAGVRDETQIHTHMCYADFNDIIEWIARMDADVISIEASRSGMALLDAFARFHYPNEVGPGVYDIHSPRVPSVEEMVGLLKAAARHIAPDRLWVNPDCGLKTRQWPEVMEALGNMVQAARVMRRDGP